MLTGEGGAVDDMGAEDPAMDPEADPAMEPTVDGEMDMEVPAEDEFGAADAAAGGEELGGREKRESKQHSKKKLK
jgi:hypothetical protein